MRIEERIFACAVLAVGLSGCGTAPQREAPLSPSIEPSSRGGGYYLDDGPGENPPANLGSIPDAVPKAEPLNAGASRPYSVNGRRYAPMTALQPYQASGTATWYGRRYHGKPTSSGELYDMYAMTAAHPTLPIPSYARVTNLENGKSVVVRINDRGPFIGDRLIDLSYTAAYRLGLLAGGSARVQVESILPQRRSVTTTASVERETPAAISAAAAQLPEPAPSAVPLSATVPTAADASPASPAPSAENSASGVHVQFGAFQSRQNAETYLTKLKHQMGWLSERLRITPRGGLYRVYVGPYPSQAEARQVLDRIGDALGARPILLTW